MRQACCHKLEKPSAHNCARQFLCEKLNFAYYRVVRRSRSAVLTFVKEFSKVFFFAGKRNKPEGAFLAVKRNKTELEGTFLAGKRNFQGTSQPFRDCVNSFSPAAPAEAMPKFFLHKLHTNRISVPIHEKN